MTDERIQEITNAVGRELGMAITVEQGRLVKRVLDAELRKEPQTFTREELGKILAEVDEYSFPTSDSPEVGDVWEKLGGKVPADDEMPKDSKDEAEATTGRCLTEDEIDDIMMRMATIHHDDDETESETTDSKHGATLRYYDIYIRKELRRLALPEKADEPKALTWETYSRLFDSIWNNLSGRSVIKGAWLKALQPYLATEKQRNVWNQIDDYVDGFHDGNSTAWTPWHEGDEVPEWPKHHRILYGKRLVNGDWAVSTVWEVWSPRMVKDYPYYKLIDCTPPAPPEPETPKTDNEDELVMFLGWLSTQEKAVVIGAQWETPYVMKYVDEWRKLRAARQIGRTT